MGVEPDLCEWITLDADATHDVANWELAAMCAQFCRLGSKWTRATLLSAHGLRYICVEGWLVRPEVESPAPTPAHAPVGFS